MGKSQNDNDSPLVSVGMPIRNGAKTLELAIESVINQTYENLEIIISDNNSTDQTAEICQQYAAQDPRIRYFRQSESITAISNFRFVFEKSHGKYFMWAAHDDFRSKNYIEVLLKGFERVSSASIVFSDILIFKDYNDYQNQGFLKYDFQTSGLRLIGKLRKTMGYALHLYGLINSKYLLDYAWYDIDAGPDKVLLCSLVCRGDFVYVAGATLYYWLPYVKTIREYSLENSLREPISFARIRSAWYRAIAVVESESKVGRYRNRYLFFLLFLSWIGAARLRGFIRSHSPFWLRAVYRDLRKMIVTNNGLQR